MIDNTNLIEKLCVFDKNSYYKFTALIRKKDIENVPDNIKLKFSTKKEIPIKEWLIDNEQQLDLAISDMRTYTGIFPCRIYLGLDRKNKKKTLMSIRNKVNTYLDLFLDSSETPDVGIKSIAKIISSASSVSESSDKDYRRWLFDIDSKDEYTVAAIEYICDRDHVATLETPNGFHVIANRTFHPMNRGFQELLKKNPNIELKSNAMTIILKK